MGTAYSVIYLECSLRLTVICWGYSVQFTVICLGYNVQFTFKYVCHTVYSLEYSLQASVKNVECA